MGTSSTERALTSGGCFRRDSVGVRLELLVELDQRLLGLLTHPVANDDQGASRLLVSDVLDAGISISFSAPDRLSTSAALAPGRQQDVDHRLGLWLPLAVATTARRPSRTEPLERAA
jgi:hypothetical protein